MTSEASITDFVLRYQSNDFQTALGNLYDAVGEDTDYYSWAVSFYRKFQKNPNDEELNKVNLYRKTCLKLLYDLVDYWKKHDFGKEIELLIKNIFGIYRLKRILAICLPMDKAQALYKMQEPCNPKPGMPWFSELHLEDIDGGKNDWQIPFTFTKQYPEYELKLFDIKSNYNGTAPMNKRLFKMLVVESFGLLDDPEFKKYIIPDDAKLEEQGNED